MYSSRIIIFLIFVAMSHSGEAQLFQSNNSNENLVKKITFPYKKDYKWTIDYFEDRKTLVSKNIALEPIGDSRSDIKLFSDFVKVYKYEKNYNDWLVFYKDKDNISNIEILIERNIKTFNKYAKFKNINLDGEIAFSVLETDSYVLNESIVSRCGLNFHSGNLINKVTFSTNNYVKLKEFCEFYPYLLGINGITLIYKNGKLIVESLK